MNISRKLSKKIRKYCENNHIGFYWDYRDELNNDQVQTIIEKGKDGYYEVSDEICELNLDCISELEKNFSNETFEYFQDEIFNSLLAKGEFKGYSDKLDYFEDNTENYKDEFFDEFRDFFYVDFSIDSLLPNDIPVKFVVYSNYDCLNSDWLNQNTYEYEHEYCSYFRAILDVLKINPARFKTVLKQQDNTMIKFAGRFPNYKSRTYWNDLSGDIEYKFYKDIARELINNTSPSNLVFLATIDLKEYIFDEKPLKKVSIPKGNECGLFSSSVGGGSLLEISLPKDIILDVSKPYGLTEYDTIEMISVSSTNDYDIPNVYACTNDIFGNSFTKIN